MSCGRFSIPINTPTMKLPLVFLLAVFFISTSKAQSCSGSFKLCGLNLECGVRGHSKIDLDIEDMDEAFDADDFSGARRAYANGGKSVKSDGTVRTLKGFSTSADDKMATEGYFKLYKAYWDNKGDYADRFVTASLDKSGMFAGKSAVFRSQTAIKGAQYQNVWMYVIHEMEDAINDCVDNQPTSNIGGVKAWDEAWAFYCGSKPGKSGAIKRGRAAGCSTWTLGQKRCTQSGTCQKGGKFAKANVELKKLFKKGMKQLSLQQCNSLLKTKNKIIVHMTAPLIQGLLRYIVVTKKAVSSDKDKPHAEGWAFAAAVLPLINHCNANSARTLVKNLKPNASPPMSDSIDTVANVVHRVLGCLGLNCRCVGTIDCLPRCTTTGRFLPVPGTLRPSNR